MNKITSELTRGERVETSELGQASSDAWFSATELAALNIDGLPRSDRRMRDVVEREGWKWREVHAKGGKRGIKREYQPPPEVMRLIEKERGSAPASAAVDTAPKEAPGVKEAEKAYAEKSAKPFDSALMERLIVEVEEALQARRGYLRPDLKARLICLIYDHCVAIGSIESDAVARFMTLIKEQIGSLNGYPNPHPETTPPRD